MDDSSVSTYSNPFSLSIRFSSDGFSLLVNDVSHNLISSKNVICLLFSMSVDEIIELLNNEPEIRVKYQEIQIILDSDKYTIIPNDLFKIKNAADFLGLQHSITPTENTAFNELISWGLVNVFSVSSTLKNALSRLFPTIEIEHHISYFLTNKLIHRSGTAVYVWLRPKMIDVVVINEGKILLINSYAYATPEDFAYYLLNIYEQLLLSKESVSLKLYNATSKPEIIALIKQYLSSVIAN